jgi:maleate isomerase
MAATPRRLGILVPSADVVVEPNFQRFIPKGIAIYTSRAHQKGHQTVSDATLNQIVDSSYEAAASLSHARPELICFCCTSASFMKGHGWDRELAEGLSKAAGGIPVTTTSSTILEALGALSIRRVFMLTPYPQARNQIEIKFFRDSGVEVAAHAHFVCKMGWEIPAIPPERVVEKALEHRTAIEDAGALFVSCTNLRAMDVAEELERELDVPVVTSNQSTLWVALGRLGVDGRGVRAGRLFRKRYPGEPQRVD